MTDPVAIPKPMVPIVVDTPKPRKPREKKPRNPEVLKRATKKYNEMAKWASFQDKPKFSEEERALLNCLYEDWKAKRFTEWAAIKKFCEQFPFRSFMSIRWRFRRLRGKR